ncbi:hypothetical protein M3226_27990 [Neobacillus cucumis]|uniref:hypothetical protein n=1 Tax=Neobacillus cucumis TaxID=1740721 RepID=UPI00203B90B6|nr:hypothetical protein [Neobacillus cucumis]MCM3729434.1 hypothetical protein [Neobacillus cucumis]
MSESSLGGFQNGAEHVRRGNFWDFMLGSYVHHPQESYSSNLSTGNNSLNQLPSNHVSVKHTNDCRNSQWQNSVNGKTQTKICWDGGNMWEYRVRRRPMEMW